MQKHYCAFFYKKCVILHQMENAKKEARYLRLIAQIESLLKKCDDKTARMATISAVLFNKMDYFFWCGFYRLVNGELIVGPYQGPPACQVLQKDKGVCWASINQGKTLVVADVEKFPGHIACDSRSKSEIVIPFKNSFGEIEGVLDVDSKFLNSFDETDARFLQIIVSLL